MLCISGGQLDNLRFHRAGLTQLNSSAIACGNVRNCPPGSVIDALKILTERAFTTVDSTTYILLMDMSKAFDTVNRETLVEDQRTIMDPQELHMIKVLLGGVLLCVRRGREKGEKFSTSTGMQMGDCVSAVLFTLYVAKAFSYQPQLNDHNYHVKSPEPPPPTSTHLIDHVYSKPICTIIDAQYADGTEWAVTGSRHVMENIRIPLVEQR